MSKPFLTTAIAALFTACLAAGAYAPAANAAFKLSGDGKPPNPYPTRDADDADKKDEGKDAGATAADEAADEAGAVEGESDEYFTACKPNDLATQTFEPLKKRKTNFLSVRIKGKFETPSPGYIMAWRKDQMPSLSATAAMELRILRPLNAYIEGAKEFAATIDKTVVVSPETKVLRIHVVRDFDEDDLTYYCEIKPVSLRARNEMDLE